MKRAAKSRGRFASQAGFTLTELLVVVAIVGIVVGLSIPNFTRSIDNAKLKDAAQQLASVYQDARLRATQGNSPYQVLSTAPGISPAQVCVDVDGDGICGGGDPITILPAQVSFNNAVVPPGLGQASLGFNPVVQNGAQPGIAWNGLGVPCQKGAAGTPCITMVGWIQYLQLQRSGGDVLYAAVTVSPTGRVKTWTYSPSANGNGSWF